MSVRARLLEAAQRSSHPLTVAILARARLGGVPIPSMIDARTIAGKGVSGRVEGFFLFLRSPAAAAERGPISIEHLQELETFNSGGKSASVLMAGEDVVRIFAMCDEPRADAKSGTDALKALGIQPLMLTGDNRGTEEAIGRSLTLEAHADLLPEKKRQIVRDLQAWGRKVAKVNDAPALAAADIGIAMGGAPMSPWKRQMRPCCMVG